MMRRLFKGRMLKRRLLEPRDEMWDRRLGVHTFGFREGSGEWGTRSWTAQYSPASYADLMRLFKAAELDASDVFTDIGSGLGRACFVASYMGAKKVVGVELLPDLVALAEANRWDSRLAHRDIRFVCTDALTYSLADTTLLYLFHSLSEENLTDLIEKAREDRLVAGTRTRFRIAYLNPVFDDVFARAGWLKRTHELPVHRNLFASHPYAATIWEATD